MQNDDIEARPLVLLFYDGFERMAEPGLTGAAYSQARRFARLAYRTALRRQPRTGFYTWFLMLRRALERAGDVHEVEGDLQAGHGRGDRTAEGGPVRIIARAARRGRRARASSPPLPYDPPMRAPPLLALLLLAAPALAGDGEETAPPPPPADRALPHHPGGIAWEKDLAAAREAAARDHRPLIAYFTFDT